MATKEWDKFIADYKKLAGPIAKYCAKTTMTHIATFEASYKKCQSLEDKLTATLIPARKYGVVGDTLKDFKKDKNFGAVYKMLDSEVNDLFKAQQAVKEWTNHARQTADQIKGLQDYIAKEVKARKTKPSPADQKELDKLLAQMAVARKDLETAGNLMSKSIDSKMSTYVDKFNRNIEKLLDLAPKVEGAPEKSKVSLPKDLQQAVLDQVTKKMEALSKRIEKHCDVAVEKAKTNPIVARVEMKAASASMYILDKLATVQSHLQKKHAKVIATLDDKQKAVMKRVFEKFTSIHSYAEKKVKQAESKIDSIT